MRENLHGIEEENVIEFASGKYIIRTDQHNSVQVLAFVLSSSMSRGAGSKEGQKGRHRRASNATSCSVLRQPAT